MKECPNCKFRGDYTNMTPTEKEVLSLKLRGFTNVELAARIFKSPKTTATYWSRIRMKLGITVDQSTHGVLRAWISRKLVVVPDFDEPAEFREGYMQALTDVLEPDLALFDD